MNPLRKLVVAASLGAGIASFVSVASALPVVDALAIKNAAPPTLEAPPGRGTHRGRLARPKRGSLTPSGDGDNAVDRVRFQPTLAKKTRHHRALDDLPENM